MKYKLLAIFCILTFFTACKEASFQKELEKNELFSLNYGNYENELYLFNLENAHEIKTMHTMKDGLFYILNGESGKLLKLNSYGDLVSVIYNDTKNPTPVFKTNENKQVNSALETQIGDSTKIAVTYPFNDIGPIAVDKHKNIYIVDQLPVNRFEENTSEENVLSQIVLRFAPDGSFINYLTQDGIDGKPFPNIQSIHTNENNELIVICFTEQHYITYWFSQEGTLINRISLDKSMIRHENVDLTQVDYISLEQIIPDYNNPVLYLKLDYYDSTIDESTMISSGIKFVKSVVYPLNVLTNTFEESISIPAYEKSVKQSYGTEIFLHPYTFLGAAENGGLYFYITNEQGLALLVSNKNSKKIIQEQIAIPLEKSLYQYFSVSNNGIISALIAHEEKVDISWWRTDSLLKAIEN